MTEHNLVISPGDEETWCKCSCGWIVPGGYPSRYPRTLNDVFESWYWSHAIQYIEG